MNNVLVRNNVNISGKGNKVLLFAPGFGCDQNMWRFVAPAFQEDYRIILFDYVGSGRSDYDAYVSTRYSELSGYADDIIEICAALDIEEVTIIGHSVGSTIGMLTAMKRPELVNKLVLIGPSPCYLNDPPKYYGGFEKEDLDGLINMMELNYIGWANYLSKLVMKNPERPELSEELEASFCSTDPEIQREFAVATFMSDYRSILSNVHTPSLILQCTEDTIAPVKVGEYMSNQMPNSTLQQMKATGHCPHMSHPKETIELIKEYLTAKE